MRKIIDDAISQENPRWDANNGAHPGLDVRCGPVAWRSRRSLVKRIGFRGPTLSSFAGRVIHRSTPCNRECGPCALIQLVRPTLLREALVLEKKYVISYTLNLPLGRVALFISRFFEAMGPRQWWRSAASGKAPTMAQNRSFSKSVGHR